MTKKLIYLPETYDLVVGDTFELFYRGILLVMNPSHYNVRVTCARGSAYIRKFVFTPTESDIGEYPLTVDLIDDLGNIIESGKTTLVVRAVAQTPADDTYVLCVGDSLTAGGDWPSEAYRRFTATDGTPTGHGLTKLHFLGSKEGKHGAYFEGYGGWVFGSYNSDYSQGSYFKYIITDHNKTDYDRHSVYTDGSSKWKLEEIEDGRIKLLRTYWGDPLNESGGTLTHVSGGVNHEDIVYTEVKNAANNPFWNDVENRVDFAGYVKKLGAPRVDICFVLLGWNSSNSTEEAYKPQVRTFLDNLRRDYPKCKIVLMGLQMTSYDGLGLNYGTSWNYIEKNEYTKRLGQWYVDLCGEYDNMSYIDIAGQFDSEYNYATLERPANVRTEKTEVIQSNGVHPNLDGYMQIGDAVYRKLNGMLGG